MILEKNLALRSRALAAVGFRRFHLQRGFALNHGCKSKMQRAVGKKTQREMGLEFSRQNALKNCLSET
jgi:hypothetical protein